jgi:prepilin-type N-terminal cleavage/methylation domain-containing protein
VKIEKHGRCFKAGIAGFSLIEVVITLAIIALTVPIIIGLFALFSRSSGDAVDREEASRAFIAVSLFLNGGKSDAQTGAVLASSFSTVAGWVATAQKTPVANGKGQVLYAYKTRAATAGLPPTEYLVSLTAPSTGTTDGKIMVAEIRPPATTLISQANLAATSSLAGGTAPTTGTPKPYVPLQIAIYSVSAAAQVTAWQTQAIPPMPIDTYPLVVNR